MCVCVCLCVYCLTCVRVRMYVCVCVCVCVYKQAHPDMRMSFVEAKTQDELKASTVTLQQRISAPQ